MKILLPVDGSEGALEAVREALRMRAAGLRASFVLANVQEPASLYEVVVAHSAKVIEEVSAAAARHSLAPAQQMLREAGAEFDTEIGHGDPGQLLVEMASEAACDLVVIGARGMDIAATGALGSVADSVLRNANVPVMLVRRRPG